MESKDENVTTDCPQVGAIASIAKSHPSISTTRDYTHIGKKPGKSASGLDPILKICKLVTGPELVS